MKKAMLMVVAALCAVSLRAAEGGALAEARAQIGAAIADPAKMTEIVKGLSAADQKAYLAEVNAAITKMPGSNESKAATFLNINRAALKGAAKGNLVAMIAEVFATVPAEVLPLLNERYAADLFNRAADPSVTYTDAQYVEMAQKVMAETNERMKTVENGPARSAFVILMLVRASNGSIPTLQETLIETLPEAVQNQARTEWIPAAMGDNQAKTYEPLLGAANAPVMQMLSNDVIISLAGPQLLESLLGDIIEGTPLVNNSNRPELNVIPARDRDNDVVPINGPTKEQLNPEPGGYQNQLI